MGRDGPAICARPGVVHDHRGSAASFWPGSSQFPFDVRLVRDLISAGAQGGGGRWRMSNRRRSGCCARLWRSAGISHVDLRVTLEGFGLRASNETPSPFPQPGPAGVVRTSQGRVVGRRACPLCHDESEWWEAWRVEAGEWIAVYGAVVATGVAAWQAITYWVEHRPKVRVSSFLMTLVPGPKPAPGIDTRRGFVHCPGVCRSRF